MASKRTKRLHKTAPTPGTGRSEIAKIAVTIFPRRAPKRMRPGTAQTLPEQVRNQVRSGLQGVLDLRLIFAAGFRDLRLAAA